MKAFCLKSTANYSRAINITLKRFKYPVPDIVMQTTFRTSHANKNKFDECNA